ncbi:MAG TPA: tetratricopeptide repeat protein [Candidatus Polarisedimenticolia bacterium]|nr:tetratricopeptide repeat protein [Candidatus Polarisedimenticolia bacterium]
MQPEHWNRIKIIFDEVMDVPPERRTDFLARACGTDTDLQRKVQGLIDNAEGTTDFLETEYRERILPRLKPPIEVFAAGDVISGRYRVLHFIARGGMGEVYEVEDSELQTRIALKTVSLTVAPNLQVLERFKREIKLARKVTHPNVCRVFDVGHHIHPAHGEIMFLTMELLQGETLAVRLRRQGPMTCEQALPLIHQMVLALSIAHDLGIVHRDFKPGNVMLLAGATQEIVKVTDFGLATSLESEETSPTSYGQVVGTPDYMAPEQFRGRTSTETDVYALGLVIFEMVTGRLPVSRQNPFKLSGTTVQPYLRLKISSRWQIVIAKCLAPEPSNRYRDVDEVWDALSGYRGGKRFILISLASALNRHRLICGSILLLLIALFSLIRAGTISDQFTRLPSQKHIAVLPFQNIGSDAANQAFSEGVVESLTVKLSQLERFQKSFWVVPSSDTRQLKSLDEAYRKTNATLAITGSIQHTGNGIVLTANLVDLKNHRQLAARTIHAASIDLEGLQDRVWESVADMVDLQVSPELARTLNAGGTKHPGAYELYEQGVGYSQHFDNASIDHAIDLFTNALGQDPGYALAFAGLGTAYATKYVLTKDPQWIEKATWNGHHALELNDRLIPVHVTLGIIYQQTGELDKALAELGRALDDDSTYVGAEYHIGQIYESQGKLSEAEAVFNSVVNRRPGYWLGYSGLGTFYYEHGEFAKAATQFQAMIDLQPDNPLGYYDLGGAYLAMARYEDAISVLKRCLTLKETSDAWTNLGAAYMYINRYQEAADAMKKATELDPHNDILWRNLGDSYRQIPSRAAEAMLAYQKALQAATDELKVNPNSSEVLSGIALYNAHLGRTKDAETSIAKVLRLAPKDSDVLFTSALVYEIIGHRGQAISAIDQAVKAGYSIEEVESEPELRELRSAPRYQQWLQRMKSNASIDKD